MPGLGPHLGPHFPERQTKFKEAKAKRKKMKSKAKAERERVDKRPERRKRRAEKIARRAQRKVEERQKRADRGEPEVARAKKSTTNSHHGTEQVNSYILKLLRKSHKSKKVGKGRQEAREAKKEGREDSKACSTEKKVDKPKVVGPKWTHGMREQAHECSTGKAKQRKKIRTRAENLEETEESANEVKKPGSVFSKAEEDTIPSAPDSPPPELTDSDIGMTASSSSSDEEDEVAISGDIHISSELPTTNISSRKKKSEEEAAFSEEVNISSAPDYALPSSGEEAAELASPLPDQSPLDPEAFCMKFFQVIKKQSCFIKFI